MHNVYGDIRYLKGILKKKIQQPFVERHLQRPFIDEDKLFLAYALFHNEPMIKSRDEYITSMMLIQLALDTHDNLPHLSERPMLEIEKQLSVLVGDYYSGLYYNILANLEDIHMIHLVAKSIKEINEQKMKVYYNNIHSFEDLLNILMKTESILFKHIANYLKSEITESIITKFLLASRIQREKSFIEQNKFSYIQFYAHNELKYTEDGTITHMLGKYYDEIVKELDNQLNHLPFEHTYIREYMTKRLGMFYKTTIAEEG